jgi:hypothetical protein
MEHSEIWIRVDSSEPDVSLIPGLFVDPFLLVQLVGFL